MKTGSGFSFHFFAAILVCCVSSTTATAAQKDISGPAGSVDFGKIVKVLPNGNIVVIDPISSGFGAAYLYSPSGQQISMLTGSTDNDYVGSGGVVVLSNGNYVIVSPFWTNGSVTNAGAVTWASSESGVSGVISASNSLIGTFQSEMLDSVFPLTNGNYVVTSPGWNGGLGAATWCNGQTGLSGMMTSGNSLTGSASNDGVGFFVTPLTNGNYVVSSDQWSGTGDINITYGAVTLGNGVTGTVGVVSSVNSLVGTHDRDNVGQTVTALMNGNYVVGSSSWNNNAGAATWGDGSSGVTGPVSESNSLIGTGDVSVTALTNGNFVVASPNWNDSHGAATWGNGATGVVGTISASNSLVGDDQNDHVGNSVVALNNGNYVVSSIYWHGRSGAAAWGNGSTGTSGVVSATNALVGGEGTGDDVSQGGVTALTNGNYVVASPGWGGSLGAATWGNGLAGVVGTPSVTNSLTGSISGDYVGYAATALRNGNYVVSSGYQNYGAYTWGSGASGSAGTVSSSNSLVGEAKQDEIGSQGIAALSNGNFIVSSPYWNGNLGAATYVNGTAQIAGIVSTSNSLTGSTAGDEVADYGTQAFDDGVYVVYSLNWQNSKGEMVGAVTALRDDNPIAASINSQNSVIGLIANPNFSLVYDYSAVTHLLVVGRPAENIVTLFNTDLIFSNGFE